MQTFRSLRHRNYRLYFIGQLISLIGTWMQTAALAWLAFALTGESTWPALITTATILPTCLFGPIGGRLADSYPKRRLILVTQILFLVIAGILTGLTAIGLERVWPLLVLMLLHGCVQAIDLPTRLAFVPDLIPREDLANAVALNSVQFNSARALGPAIGGVCLVYAGPTWCFFINALSYFAVLACLLRMKLPPELSREANAAHVGLFAGFRYLREQRRLGAVVLLAGGMAFCGWPIMSLLPAYASRVLGAREETYSLLLSSVGGGAMTAALLVATFSSESRRARFLVLGSVLLLLGLTFLARADSVGPAALSCATIGFGLICFFTNGQAIVQLGSANEIRGRVMACWAMTLSGATPIGNALVGPLADQLGERRVIAGMALAAGIVACGTVALSVPMSRRTTASVPGESTDAGRGRGSPSSPSNAVPVG